MKPRLKILVAGLSIIVLTNVMALGGVAYNRSGEPEAVVELTERELRMPNQYRTHKENTGLALSFQCRIEKQLPEFDYGGYGCWSFSTWFDKNKLIELGFEFVANHDPEHYKRNRDLPRAVFLVMEYDGESYQRVLAQAQRKLTEANILLQDNPNNEVAEERVSKAQERLQREQQHNSRLFAIDAGLDPEVLRQTYADNNRYFFLKALVEARQRKLEPGWVWAGSIDGLLIERVNIPLTYRKPFKVLEQNLNNNYSQEALPRYQVRLAFGKRNEPWVLDTQALATKPSD